MGFVSGQACCLMDLIGWQDKGTSVHKIYMFMQQLYVELFYLEQVLPARKLARGGARPGLGTMSTSDQSLMFPNNTESSLKKIWDTMTVTKTKTNTVSLNICMNIAKIKKLIHDCDVFYSFSVWRLPLN